MSEKWGNLACATKRAEDLICREKGRWHSDGVGMRTVDSVIKELKFLYTFRGFTYLSRDTETVSRVVTAAEEFKTYLQRDFIPRLEVNTSQLLHVFDVLNEKIGLLKLEIRKGYQDCSFESMPSVPSACGSDWNGFCLSIESNLEYLSEERSLSYVVDPLRNQMKALQRNLISLCWLFWSEDYDWSPWKDNILAHFGGMIIQLAHFCCSCWYNLPPMQDQDLNTLLSDLSRKMDLSTPEFLEMSLGCLVRNYDGQDLKRYVSDFVYHILDLSGVLHTELTSLLISLLEIPEAAMQLHVDYVHSILVRIKDLVSEARYLQVKDGNLSILFLKIWSLEAEIFITFPKGDHVIPLDEGYSFLGTLFSSTDGESAEHHMLKFIEGVPKQVQSFYQSSPVADYLLHVKVSNFILKSIVHFNVLNVEAETYGSSIDLLKHKLQTLHEGLLFLEKVPINEAYGNTQDEKLIFIDIALATKVMSNNWRRLGMEIWLVDSLEKIQHLMPKLKGYYPQIPSRDFPKTPRFCFIQLLLQDLRDLLNRKHDLVAHGTCHIETICQDLELIISISQDAFVQGIEKQECKDLHTQLVYVSYQVEHVIGLMLGEDKAVWLHSLWLCCLSEEITNIRAQLANFDGNSSYNDEVQRSMPVVSLVSTTMVEEVMFGLGDKKIEITDRLIRGRCHVVSIVGMPGIGKTTLANNVFFSRRIMNHFHIRAWCCVSQIYRKRDLLLNVLSQIITITDNIHAQSDSDLEELLYKRLKGKRYLIVLDDIWSTKAWDDLRLSFPDDSIGSRLLLTSRQQDEISKISDPHPLRPLSEEESWEFLKSKVFQKEECPPDLLEVGQQIAKSCKGLPLAISAIAGILLKNCGKSENLWKQIAERVSSRIVNDPQARCKDILELSYNCLPDHLKACLLYFGAFKEDEEVSVWRLQCLWIAEGFVHKSESKSFEDLAEDYFMDLIGRSLLLVSKRRSNGKVKACRVHDVVRDLCLIKAKDDRFLQLITASDKPYSSLGSLDYGLLYERFNTSNSETYQQYRLHFCVDREQYVLSRPSGPFVRSLLFSATIADMYPRCSHDVSFIPNNFQRLRVLDLETINMGSSFGNGIELLVYLRYLAVGGDIESIPPSLSKLQNLETLLVKGLKRKVVLPDTLWRMKKLRHVHVKNHAILTLPDDENLRSFQLDSLVTLSLPYFSLVDETNEMINKFPNLRKLKFVFSEPKDISPNFCWVPALESLGKLESLKIAYYGKALNSGEMKLPSGLKELILSNFHLSWNHISEIGRLPNLEVLKLISCTFEGSSWEMKEGEFRELKYLKLDNLNIVKWDACDDYLPVLQQLVLRNCKQLEVPSDLGNIPTMEKIEVQLCGNSVNESIRSIEEQEIEGLKIVINYLQSA